MLAKTSINRLDRLALTAALLATDILKQKPKIVDNKVPISRTLADIADEVGLTTIGIKNYLKSMQTRTKTEMNIEYTFEFAA